MSQFMTMDTATGEIKPINPNIPIEAIYAALWEYETEENALTFGEMLARVRNAKKLTQQELAENLGLKQSAIAQWETGKGTPSIMMVQVLSKALATNKLWGAYERDNTRRHNKQLQKIKRLQAQNNYDERI